MDVGALQRYQEELERSWNNIGERISWGAVFVSLIILSANCQGTTKIRYLYLGARHILWIKIGQTGTLRHIATYRDTLHISHDASLRAAHFTAKRLAQRRRAKDCCTLNPGASPIMEDHGKYDRYESIGNQQIWLQRPKTDQMPLVGSSCCLQIYFCFGKHTLHSGKSMKSR